MVKLGVICFWAGLCIGLMMGVFIAGIVLIDEKEDRP